MSEIIDYLIRTIGYIARTINRRFAAQESTGWPVQTGTVARSLVESDMTAYVGEVTYTYICDGEYYGGTHRQPFVFEGSAKDYVDRFEPGSDISVRVKPGQPEISFIDRDDQLQDHAPRVKE